MGLLDNLLSPPARKRAEDIWIGGCRLIRKLAESPMSTVHLAEDRRGRQVAVKLLSPHGSRIAAQTSATPGRPWEGERAKPLRHPNVVRTLACGQQDDAFYIVMEYLSGGTFSEHVRQGSADVLDRRLDILIAAARGLAYVHENDIIHRDICPRNLMFDSHGTVKLIDFGVAIHASDRLQPAQVRTGRPSYLAPELIRHNLFNVQTDVYAFGVTLYEAFVGHRPFVARDRKRLLSLHLLAAPVPPSKVNPALGPEVDRLVLRALEKAPERRFATMNEVIAELEDMKS